MRTLLPILLLALTAACADNAETSAPATPTEGARLLHFSAYTGRSTLTRTCQGPIDSQRLRQADAGFGVFAYQTARTPYADYRRQNATRRLQPEYLRNARICWDSLQSAWVFADPAAATQWPADDQALLSFFAYAPYMADAIVDYAATECCEPALRHTLAADPAQQTDLLWATAGQGGARLHDDQPFAVCTDLTRQACDGTVAFLFKHALSKIGGAATGTASYDEDVTTPASGLMVVLDVDEGGPQTGATLQPYDGNPQPHTPYNTKVTLNAIDIHYGGQPDTGLLNLATGQWTQLSATQPGLLRTQHVALHQSVAEPSGPTPHTRQGFESLPIGVTTVPKNVCHDGVPPLFFLPGTQPVLDITIDYTVRTFDSKLSQAYTEVRQRISKRLHIQQPIELNKQYNILMHIGLTSINFSATVDDWDAPSATHPDGSGITGDTVTTSDETTQHVYLPSNVEP